jgi:hypothetical protein
MDQTNAMGAAAAGALDLMAERRRRPVRSPVSLSQLATRAWRATSPFAPLLLLGMVFGLSLGVVHFVESSISREIAKDPSPVSTPPPAGS